MGDLHFLEISVVAHGRIRRRRSRADRSACWTADLKFEEGQEPKTTLCCNTSHARPD